MNNLDLDQLVGNIINQYGVEELDMFLGQQDYTEYKEDPVGFCQKELGMVLTDDVQNMMRSVWKNRVTIAISGNGPGKTHGASAIAIAFKKIFPGSQVICSAPNPSQENLKKKLFPEIKAVIREHPLMFSNYYIHSLDIIEKDDEKSFITGATAPTSGGEEVQESKFSGQHRPYLLFILDEGDGIQDEVFKAIDGCMSGGFCRLLVMFNPKRKAGAAYRKITDKKAAVVRLDVLKHPNVVTGKEIIPGGCCSREKTVQRINEWTRPLVKDEKRDSNCFEVPDFLIGSVAVNDAGILYPPLKAGYRVIEDPQFWYKVLGEYPIEGSDQLISQSWIDAARSRWDMYRVINGVNPPEGVRPSLGMDVADEGGDYNAVTIRYGSWIKEVEKWRGLDLDKSTDRAAKIYIELRASIIFVESDGLGGGLVPRLRRIYYWYCEKCNKTFADQSLVFCPDCSTESAPFEMKKEWINAYKNMMSSSPTQKTEMGEFGTMRDQLWWSLREWLWKDQTSTLPPNDKNWEMLTIMKFEERSGKIKVTSKDEIRKDLGHSPDEADSIIQTFYEKSRPRIRMLSHSGKEV